VTIVPGFLTHYLIGMETCENLTDNYIYNVIRKNNHAFLIGLQGTDILSFNLHALSSRGLSYRTASMSLRNQEYAAFFNNMLDHISTIQDNERDICIAYMAGFLCFYAIEQSATPYVMFRVWQDLPAKCHSHKMIAHRREIETVIDTILLRSHCHIEPSQLNFEALTFANRKELSAIGRMMRYAVMTTYKYKMPSSEISNGIHTLRRQTIYLQPNSKFKRIWCRTLEKTMPLLPLYKRKIYEDFQTDEADYMNSEHKPWYAYPGCLDANNQSFEEIFTLALQSSHELLEGLDSCLSWGMDCESLINSIIHFTPYQT
jgi:hypothetical protein